MQDHPCGQESCGTLLIRNVIFGAEKKRARASLVSLVYVAQFLFATPVN